MSLILRAARYVRQAHNLNDAGSNPAPRNQLDQHFFNLSYVKKNFKKIME